MKRVLAILLSAVLLFAICPINTNAAEENLCSIFQEELTWFLMINDDTVENYDAGLIAYRTYLNFPNRDNYKSEKKFDDSEFGEYSLTCYNLPGSKFESLANKLFAVKVNLQTVNSMVFMEEFSYNAENQTYDVLCYEGGGDFPEYEVAGYTKKGNDYTVYFQKDGGKIKMDVSYDGTYIKMINQTKINSIPSGITTWPVVGDESADDKKPTESKKPSTSTEKKEEETKEQTQETPISVETDGAKVEADAGVFPANVVVQIAKLSETETQSKIDEALETVAEKFVAFEITAMSDNIAVQPNGKVEATFQIPDDYDLDKVVVLYVSTDGEVETIASKVDKDKRQVVAELSHFSTYVVAEEKADTVVDDMDIADTDGAIDEDKGTDKDTGNSIVWIGLAIVVVLAGGAGAWWFLYYKKQKQGDR